MHCGVASGSDDDSATETEGGTRVPVTKEFVFKVVVVGNHAAGKTALIHRLVECGSGATPAESFGALPPTKPTIGTDFCAVAVEAVLPGTNVRLQLWDTAGLERYAAQNSSVFPHASLLLCVFDVSVAESLRDVTEKHLTAAAEFLPDLEQSSIFVVGNKTDLIAAADPAVRENQKRAAATDVSFLDADTNANGSDADLLTEDIPPDAAGDLDGAERFLGREGILTREEVRAMLLDVFGEVHYAETSALTGSGVPTLRRRLCAALLLNASALGSGAAADEALAEEDEHTALRHSVLPDAPLTSALPAATTAAARTQTQGQGRAAAPAAGTEMLSATMSPKEADEGTEPYVDSRFRGGGGGSWQSSGFQFDMQQSGGSYAPAVSNDTAIFSPASGAASPGSVRNRDKDDNDEDGGSGEAQRGRPAPPPGAAKDRFKNLTPAERRAKEKEEMDALLGKAAQKRPMGGDPSAAAAAADEPTHEAPGRAGGNTFHSLLDDRANDSRPRRAWDADGDDGYNASDQPNNRNDDSDDDDGGVRFKELVSGRFKDIEHDARLEKERIKREKKMEKKLNSGKSSKDKELSGVAKMYKKEKSKSNCNCVVM